MKHTLVGALFLMLCVALIGSELAAQVPTLPTTPSSTPPATQRPNPVPQPRPEGSQACPVPEIRVFGFDLLQQGPPPAAEALERALTAMDYRLGAGDLLTINIWRPGKPPNTFDVLVSPENKVFVPALGDIQVAGLTIDAFAQRLRRNLTAHLPGFQVSVLLAAPRSFRVLVVGEVMRPGYITANAVTRVSEVIAAACLSQLGSLRTIRLGEVTRTVDLYRFLIQGTPAQNPLVSDVMTIMVPQRFGIVDVKGAVGRPGVYEIKSGETLGDLLRYAGGPAADAFLQRAELSRLRPADGGSTDRDVLNVNLEGLRGNSATAQNVVLQPGDILTIYSRSFFRGGKVQIAGSVRNPGSYELTEGMMLKDLLFRSGGLLPDADMERTQLERTVSGQRVVLPLDLAQLLLEGDEDKNIQLQFDDAVFVPSLLAMAKLVFVEGRVARPGGYAWRENESVNTLLARAGGVVLDAPQSLGLSPVAPSPADLTAAYVERVAAGGEKRRLPVDLNALLVDRNIAADLPLLPGDVLVVPARMRQVFVEGEVMRPGAYAFEPNRTVRYYVELATPGEMAEWQKVLVRRQDGSTTGGLDTIVQAGDVILVPKQDVMSLLGFLGLVIPVLRFFLGR